MSMPAKWTVMVYMAGDNQLSSAGDRDLIAMRRIGSTEDVNVVVEFDNAGDGGTRRFRVQRHGAEEAVEQLGATDSGSPDVLAGFVDWCARHFPAERYALILWNHGGGWAPIALERIAQSVNAPRFQPSEAVESSGSELGRAFFRSTLKTVFSLDTSSERALCAEDGSGHSLDTVELGRVMRQVSASLGQPLDILGMDACLMSNIEVAYQLRDHVRFMVASEETEPAGGWPYERVLALFTERPDANAAALAAGIVDACVASCECCQFHGTATQTALDLARMGYLAGAIDQVAEALLGDMARHYPVIWLAQKKSTRFAGNTLWDTGHLCAQLADLSPDPSVTRRANAVVEAHLEGAGKPVVAFAHRGSQVERCHGTSLYAVPPVKDISRFYSDVDFAADFRWLRMLRAYHEV